MHRHLKAGIPLRESLDPGPDLFSQGNQRGLLPGGGAVADVESVVFLEPLIADNRRMPWPPAREVPPSQTRASREKAEGDTALPGKAHVVLGLRLAILLTAE